MKNAGTAARSVLAMCSLAERALRPVFRMAEISGIDGLCFEIGFPRQGLMASRKQSGFSMLELTMVIGIALIMAGVTAVAVPRVFLQEHLDASYNITLNFLRRAHDLAADDMRVYIVTFSLAVPGLNGGTIAAVDPSTGVQLFSETLPPDVTYHVEPGSPNTNLTTPDGFGTASNGAFDFD